MTKYVKADTLKEGNYLGMPIPKYTKDSYFWTHDKCTFYGIMLSDAFTLSNDNKRYFINMQTLNTNTIKFLECFLQNNNIHLQTDNSLPVSSLDTIGLSKNLIYDDLLNKKCVEDVLHLPKTKLNAFIKGLLDFNYNTREKKRFNNSSKNIIQSLRYIFLKYQILLYGNVNTYEKNDVYYLNIPQLYMISHNEINVCNYKFTYFLHDDILWSKIITIDVEEYEGKVYDFNMIDNHNYLTESGLVHNSGRRKGSFAIYLSPDHPDIFEFLDLRKNQGNEHMRARDLFLAMWIPDLFMKKVQENAEWYLMCPDECPGLNDVYGDDYDNLYNNYVEKGMYRKKVKAQDIWTKILDSQMETGTPYLLYKDSINKKSNQKNIGVIKSSNLCVAPDTMILTSDGYYRISELENHPIRIWNGTEFTHTIVKKTGESQELIKIILSNGSYIQCTPYHKFYNKEGICIDAKDLKKGTILIDYNLCSVADTPLIDLIKSVLNYKPLFFAYHDNININKNNNLGIDVIINKPISIIEINKLINIFEIIKTSDRRNIDNSLFLINKK